MPQVHQKQFSVWTGIQDTVQLKLLEYILNPISATPVGVDLQHDQVSLHLQKR